MQSILVVDDDRLLRDMLRDMLESWGFRVITAADGEEGMRKFGTDDVSLVITDIVMPDTDGIALLKRLKKTAPKVPVIAISGWPAANAPLYLNASQALGADAVLAKPFTMKQMRREIDNFLPH